MKTKSFLFSILFLLLSISMMVSCSPNSTDDELYEIEKSASGKGSQGSTGGGGNFDPEDDNL